MGQDEHTVNGPSAEEPPAFSRSEAVLDALLQEGHVAAPHEVPGLFARHAAQVGAGDALAYLVDLRQSVLVPFFGSDGPGQSSDHKVLPVDTTLAGRAFQHLEVLTQALDPHGAGTRVWLPLLDGTERLGVLGVTVDAGIPTEDLQAGPLGRRLRQLASLMAEMVVSKTLYGDTIVRVRRRVEMGLAAEMQWSLLPPLTFASKDVSVAAGLEPAYEVAGDSVDYAVDEGCARFAIFDGMGHGLQSAHLSVLAVAAYRNARRAGRPLTQTAQAVDTAVHTIYDGNVFSTAVLAELDTTTGMLSWINAGHPEPLLLRQGRLVHPLRNDPALPFGLGPALTPDASPTYTVGTEHLQPGDQVVFYTDGVVEARAPDGTAFGVPRLVDLLTRTGIGLPAPEVMRRLVHALMDHQQGDLTDDATLLLVRWRSGDEHQPML